MSGFVAIVDLDGAPVDRALLGRLTEALRPRGNDRLETWTDGCIGLGYALFRTTDEAAFDEQPNSLDGTVWIAANARIDARTDLLAALGLAAEVQLAQTPDSDLILHAYHKWGRSLVEHLLGDFSFALWDACTATLFCARDRFGMKPLYYAPVGKTLVLSNSLACLLAHPKVPRDLDEQAIADFLLFGDHTWTDPAQTSISAIRKLPPAHTLTAARGHLEIEHYWSFPREVPLWRYRREGEVLERFNEVFRLAIEDRLRTSPVAIAMSGGLDSTSIAATVRDLEARTGRNIGLRGFCVLYDSIHDSEERRYVTLAAEHLDLDLELVDGGEYSLLAPAVATCRPVEIYQPSLWLHFEEFAATYSRVMLTGEAGDNLLSYTPIARSEAERGWSRVLGSMLHLRRRYGSWPGLGTGMLARLRRIGSSGDTDALAPYPYPTWLNPEIEQRLHLKERWREYWTTQYDGLNQRHPRVHEALTRPNWSVEDTYLTGKRVLPESRDPYLDWRLIELVLSLPSLPWLFRKHLLRQAMATKLPQAILRRPKTPLGSLQDSLLSRPESEWVDSWEPLADLDRFIDRSQISFLRQRQPSPQDSYVSLRPLLLLHWLRSIPGEF